MSEPKSEGVSLEELLKNVRPATESELKEQADNYGKNYKPGPRQAVPFLPVEEVSDITRFVCSAPTCTDGEHKWDGPTVQIGRAYSVSCSKCGVSAFEVDTFMGGF